MTCPHQFCFDIWILSSVITILLQQQDCRYPCIPRRKRCALAVRSIDPPSGLAYALSAPPGKYGRKAKTQRNRRGFAQAVDHVVQFDDNRGTSPGLEMLLTFR